MYLFCTSLYYINKLALKWQERFFLSFLNEREAGTTWEKVQFNLNLHIHKYLANLEIP